MSHRFQKAYQVPPIAAGFKVFVARRLNGLYILDEREIEDGVICRPENTVLEWRKESAEGVTFYRTPRHASYEAAIVYFTAFLWSGPCGARIRSCPHCGVLITNRRRLCPNCASKQR